jgi:hypothetical protein
MSTKLHVDKLHTHITAPGASKVAVMLLPHTIFDLRPKVLTALKACVKDFHPAETNE